MGIADELQKLEQLRASGALTDDEFALAKTRLLSAPSSSVNADISPLIAEQLAEVRYQNELARIDREWEIDRRQFQVAGRYGRVFTPTYGMGIATAVVGGIFGAFWTVIAMTMTSMQMSMAPDVGPFRTLGTVFPLIGVLFTVGAIVRGFYCCIQASRYNEALAAYQERRMRTSVEASSV